MQRPPNSQTLVVSALCESTPIVSKLLSLYAQFDDLDSAVSLFNAAARGTDTIVWNLIIKAYVDSGLVDSAFGLYKRMRELCVVHDSFTFPIINQSVLLLQNGMQCRESIHCLAIRMGFDSDIYFCNTMIEVYVKYGCFGYARQLFDEMCHRDLVSWTSTTRKMVINNLIYTWYILIYYKTAIPYLPLRRRRWEIDSSVRAIQISLSPDLQSAMARHLNQAINMVIHASSSKPAQFLKDRDVPGAFMLFHEMRMEFEPNIVTVMVMVQACSISTTTNGRLTDGRQLHGYAMKKGFLIDRSVKNSILKMYIHMDNVNDAELCFREIDNKDTHCFHKMQIQVIPSFETLTLLISAFTEGGDLFQGKQIHCLSVKSGLLDNILKTCLLDFYAKSGELEASAKLFREIPQKNSITWNAMMSGFNQNGSFKEAIELFQQMLAVGVEPVAEILRSLLVAYTNMGALQLGKEIHGYLIKNNFFKEDGVLLETSILNMYIRCGNISSARICFNRMPDRDIVTWSSMIEGCGTHGMGFEALELFHRMVDGGIEPNSVTFLSLLFACSHSGLLSEGCEVFNSMRWRFGVEPDLNHYTCLVDLLGRSGKLKEALAIIVKMVAFPDSRIWGALLAGSRVYGDQNVREYAGERVLELKPNNAGYYTVLSNAQASVERWSEVEEVRNVMKDKDLMKRPGWSCIELKGLLHGFVSGDRSHPRVVEISEILECLSRKMQDL
ncbi:pentatricopeptide repeat-containing protein At4g21065-like [Cornus florida]|uniref:pentatricopeptide repeat-containing protein At4g21065-like n=1 Tax=Cornus florida TaxID=4283 RepID=UPI00289BA038|nr:pentatricopeptide repeat-containing protein At4g21065-like [Cornus florida]